MKLFETGFKAMAACLALGLAGIIFIVIAPALLGIDPYAKTQDSAVLFILNLLPVLTMLMLILSGLLSMLLMVLALIEVAESKKSTGWKLLWAILLLLTNILGIVIYFFLGRKEWKK